EGAIRHAARRSDSGPRGRRDRTGGHARGDHFAGASNAGLSRGHTETAGNSLSTHGASGFHPIVHATLRAPLVLAQPTRAAFRAARVCRLENPEGASRESRAATARGLATRSRGTAPEFAARRC